MAKSKRFDELVALIESRYEFSYQVLNDMADFTLRYAAEARDADDLKQAEALEWVAGRITELAQEIKPIEESMA
jgi:hypothetical protein